MLGKLISNLWAHDSPTSTSWVGGTRGMCPAPSSLGNFNFIIIFKEWGKNNHIIKLLRQNTGPTKHTTINYRPESRSQFPNWNKHRMRTVNQHSDYCRVKINLWKCIEGNKQLAEAHVPGEFQLSKLDAHLISHRGEREELHRNQAKLVLHPD